MQNKKSFKIGVVESPYLRIFSSRGFEWSLTLENAPLFSSMNLLAGFIDSGFDARLVNLHHGNYRKEIGHVAWRGKNLTKVITGGNIFEIDPGAYDLWTVTSNYLHDREAVLMVIEHLSKHGKPVVAGGSNAIGEPALYLKAGAAAVVTDKSGAANRAIVDYMLGKTPKEDLSGVILANGKVYKNRVPPMSPENWPLPSLEIVKECLGTESYFYSEGPASHLNGSILLDIGCDRKCNFCMTPSYRLGYQRMSPETALKWCSLYKQAGAEFIQIESDQFLGRLLYKNGRQEVTQIVNGLRDMDMPFIWSNGIELKKLTADHGMGPNMTPDEELIQTLFGWDGKNGCLAAYLAAERPLTNRESYSKLLPWKEHCKIIEAIVKTKVPYIGYGVIVGLPDDRDENLLYLEEAVSELYNNLKKINPLLIFNLVPFAIIEIPGTPITQHLNESGLSMFTEEPVIAGNLFTGSADTYYIDYKRITYWSLRLEKIGDLPPKVLIK